MKVFISWSGEESKQVALLLKPWLKKLLQACEPWMSDVDIEPGTRWSNQIANELQGTKFGILCVTAENSSSQWLNFEAGALSIAIEDTERRVVPLLLGYEDKSALSGSPVGAFNSVLFTKDDIWKLVVAMNGELINPLDMDHLGEVFELFWPGLEKGVKEILTGKAPKAPKLTQGQMTEEILRIIRNMETRQRRSAPMVRRSPDENIPVALEHGTQTPHKAWMIDMLPPTERAVLEKVSLGMSNAEIGEELNLKSSMVEDALYALFTRFKVASRKELHRFAVHAFSVLEN